MGSLLGLIFGIGVLLLWRSGSRRPMRAQPTGTSVVEGLRELIAQSGLDGLRPGQVVAASATAAVLSFGLAAAASRSVAIALAFSCFGGYAPVGLLRYRHRRRAIELRDLWPEVVDNIASGVRAGLSLPEALGEVGVRGPATLRRPFRRFAADYRANGRFADCLDRLKAALADPVGDRIVESVRIARDVGGSDLGRLLRTLSAFLREDARTRAELETRQGWTVNAARLALAAPWVMLALLALNPEAANAYDSAPGVLVLLGGGAVSLTAYRLMLRVARLPAERRMLR